MDWWWCIVAGPPEWSSKILDHHRCKRRDLICSACTTLGCSQQPHRAQNFHTYNCASCNTRWGHLKYDKKNHSDLERAERENTLQCLECQKKLKCAACSTLYLRSFWSKSERENALSLGTPLVCRMCRDRGCTAHDIKLYPCQNCRIDAGSTKFDKQLLENYKHHGKTKLICISCKAKAKARERTLKDQLRQSARICKCFCLIHQDKCPLTPACHGDRRWPGSDGFISLEDRIFLDELQPMPQWWARAWGRK